jgi:2-polyprenyl-3-methyl-5-hydroxy-6-metoxy-1,4-benzoquinol methylase
MNNEKARDVSEWWSSNPQTYGDLHGKPQYAGDQDSFGDAEFFEHADHAMFEWNRSLGDKVPFDRLFAYERFSGKRVLEIGCGMGAMASLWAKQGRFRSR